MEYPKVIEACPLCHCTERIVEQEVNIEKKEGRIGEARISTSSQKLLPIVDPLTSSIAFPVLQMFYDICANCGFEYPYIIKKERMTQDQLIALMKAQMGMK